MYLKLNKLFVVNKLLPITLAIITVSIFFGTTSMRCIKNDNIQQEIINYIKKTSGHTNISLSSRLIPFSISSTTEDVLRKDYIDGFSYGNENLVRNNKALISKIEDSLESTSDKLNRLCTKQQDNDLAQVKRESDGYILFLSRECSGVIYAELANSSSIIINSNEYEIFGGATTYTFKVGDNKIKRVYIGTVAKN